MLLQKRSTQLDFLEEILFYSILLPNESSLNTEIWLQYANDLLAKHFRQWSKPSSRDHRYKWHILCYCVENILKNSEVLYWYHIFVWKMYLTNLKFKQFDYLRAVSPRTKIDYFNASRLQSINFLEWQFNEINHSVTLPVTSEIL